MKKRLLMFVFSVCLIGWLLPVRALAAQEVSVTFLLSNGTWPDGEVARTVVFEGGHILCPEDIPTDMIPNVGYGGGNWVSDPVGVALDEDRTFRYFFRTMTEVTFDTAGGQFKDGSPVWTGRAPTGGCCEDFPADPQRAGYVFAGWVTELGQPFSQDTVVAGPITLRALWQQNRILTLDPNGGDWPEPQSVELPGGLVEDLPEPDREGWEFDHWNTQMDGAGQVLEKGVRMENDTTAYAQWRRIFILHLEGNYEDVEEKLAFTAEEVGILTHEFILPDMTRPGHTLVGWETASGEVLSVGDPYTVDESNNPATLAARWERCRYQVRFDETEEVRDCLWGDPVPDLPTPPPPEEGDFRFDGWYTSPGGKGSPFTADTPVTENLTVYPHWIRQAAVTFRIVNGVWAESGSGEYRVKLDVNAPLADNLPTSVPDPAYKETGTWDRKPGNAADGAVFTFTCEERKRLQLTFDTGDAPMEVLEGTCARLPTPTQTGSRFGGWYTKQGEKFEDTTPVTENTALYARWIPTVTLRYDANGGENPPAPETVDAVKDTHTFTVSAEIPTRAGYSFQGWADGADAQLGQLHGGDPCSVAGDTTLYAVWKKDIHQVCVTFFDRGAETARETLTAGQSLEEAMPEDPVWKNHRFLGWNFSEDGTGETLTKTTEIRGNCTVYAIWKEIPRPRITFIDRGLEVDRFALDPGDCLGSDMPPEPTRKGFTFRGWETENGTALDGSTAVNQTMTVYARWEKITRGTITFLDGDTELYQITLDLGAKIGDNLPADPSRPGFHFLGWNTREDGTGAKLYRSTALREDLTVWAQWEEIEYVELTFYNLFGDTQTVTLEQNTKPGDQFPANPARSGYSFQGWYTEPDGQGRKVSKSTKIQADTDLYAAWRQKDTTNAQTGDDPRIYLWAGILLSSASALLWLKKRKA